MSTNTPIATQTLTSAASSVTFSSIPQGYTDLIIVVNAIAVSGTINVINMTYNNDTTSGLYSTSRMVGTGSGYDNDRTSNGNVIYSGLISSTAPNSEIYEIQNYSNSTIYKTCLCRSGVPDNQIRFLAGLWRNTAPITSLTLTHNGSINFAIGSIFSIYGIQAGNKDQKATGGVVTSDGTYVYHKFLNSNIFVPNSTITADVLVIAGGGGGGPIYVGGGGGAGGLRLLTSQSFTGLSTNQVIVGAGGTGYIGSVGSNSSIGSISATGGGLGSTNSGATPYAGTAGGSGGGANYTTPTGYGAGNLGSYSPVEGYAGGTANSTGNVYGSGGGGGAGGIGGSGSNATGGPGGVGAGGDSYTNYAILNAMGSATNTGVLSSGNYYYAGGGGGASYGPGGGFNIAGGVGGGGTGSPNNGTAGTANTGGGGGGTERGGAGPGGLGGSGVVIVRYLL